MNKFIPIFCLTILITACSPVNELDKSVWQRASTQPVPLAELFPQSETLCVQSPYMDGETMAKHTKQNIPFYLQFNNMANENEHIFWLFDREKNLQNRVRVARINASFNKQTGAMPEQAKLCYPVATTCVVITEKLAEFSSAEFQSCSVSGSLKPKNFDLI